MSKTDEFICPCCGKPLSESFGGRNRTDGITLFCGNHDNCPSNEQPIAFGRSKKAAYNTLVYKYGPKDKKKGLMVEDDTETEHETQTPEVPKDSSIDKHVSYE